MPDRLLVEGVDGRIGVSLRRIAEKDHDLVDLLGQRPFLDHDVHLGAERSAAAVGDKPVAVPGHRADLADLAAEIHRVAKVSGAVLAPLTTSNSFMTLAGAKKCVPQTSCGRLRHAHNSNKRGAAA